MDGSVVVEERTPTPKGADNLCDTVAAVVEALAANAGAPIGAVGVGAPGLVDRDGVLRAAPNLIGVAEMPIRDMLVERLGVPVTVDNDATCATEAEWRHGAATGASDALLITLGTGIGGGVVSGGVLQRGAQRLHVGAGAHGRRPQRPTVCVRPPGLLGAVRIGQRARSACA